jgi:putative ABC transport system permease protein
VSAPKTPPPRESLLRVWLADAVHAARTLVTTPRYSVPAFVSLALGIGASTAVFAIFSAIILRPLPYAHEEQLVELGTVFSAKDIPNGASLSYPYYEDAKGLGDVFTSVSAWLESSLTVTGSGDAQRVLGASVTPDFFDTLQTKAILGRTFTALGASPDKSDVAVVSRSYWRSALAGGDVVGRAITINGFPMTIVGVIEDKDALPARKNVWVPIRISDEMKASRTMGMLQSVGRLRGGLSVELARQRVEAVTKAQGRHGDDGTLMYVTLRSLREALLGKMETSALLMLTAVGAFLLLACANVAALLVTRASVRSRELAVRAALGAGRWELGRHAALEALALALASSAAGAGMSLWLVHQANRLYSGELQYATAQLDGRVLVALAALVVVSTVAVGLAPTLYALRVRPMDSLRADGRTSASLGTRRLREALVAAQVAITLALLVSATILVRSVRRIEAVDPGFDPRAFSASVTSPPARRESPEQLEAFTRSVLERMQRAPGVDAAAIASDGPFDGSTLSFTTQNDPQAIRTNTDSIVHLVSAGFFDVLRIPVLSGHPFTRADELAKRHVAVVSRAFAVQNLGTERAVGRTFTFGEVEGDTPDGPKIWYEIVAVVDDVLDGEVTAPIEPTVYIPFVAKSPFGTVMTLFARGQLDEDGLAQTIRRVVRETDADATVFDPATLGSMVERSYHGRRALEQLLSFFAVASVVLAMIGLFGVTSYTVAERSSEIGIRRALGASRGDIVAMILRETGMVVVLGMVGGIACALATRTLLASFLYGVLGADVATYVAVSVGIVAMAMLASLAPARAAASVTPSRALEVR